MRSSHFLVSKKNISTYPTTLVASTIITLSFRNVEIPKNSSDKKIVKKNSETFKKNKIT
jgi:hypothetical protein